MIDYTTMTLCVLEGCQTAHRRTHDKAKELLEILGDDPTGLITRRTCTDLMAESVRSIRDIELELKRREDP